MQCNEPFFQVDDCWSVQLALIFSISNKPELITSLTLLLKPRRPDTKAAIEFLMSIHQSCQPIGDQGKN